MDTAAPTLAAGLEALARDGLLRRRRVLETAQGSRVVVDGRSLANFSSNDYLGLANHPALRKAAKAAIDAYGVGAGASPLVSGHLAPHAAAEARFAAFAGLPRAVLFPSGYAANLGAIVALVDRHGEVFGDRLNHACLHDGARLSQARYTRYPHGDVAALSRALEASTAAVKLVATDAVFSMDGDVAPLEATLALCERHGAWLLVDDAHGIGVLGAQGRGTLDHLRLRSPRILYMATLGKALGGYGAFVAGEPDAMDWLVNRARTLIYSTALPPMAAAAATAALALLEGADSPLPALLANIAAFRAACRDAGVALGESATAIQPLVLGTPERAVSASLALQEAGFLVPAIRPPTVPPGTSRLRISISAAHEPRDLLALAAALAKASA